ncbi:hypothetical protein LCGC14_1922540 [marine sediment metagenome]|uniref:Uncharacterized protein n=1 Tax=marine sediment metagenome TaxID=412755 RepID=A0A0F9GDR4_9ZZZZ
MGKMIGYLTLLIFIDLFFIATGQICNVDAGCSLGSIILNSLLSLDNVTSLSFFTEFIGDITDLAGSATGIAALAVGAAVLIGSLFIPGDIRFFIPISFSLALLVSDFVFISSYLISLNAVLATFIMAPIVIIYIFTVVEWLKGRD